MLDASETKTVTFELDGKEVTVSAEHGYVHLWVGKL